MYILCGVDRERVIFYTTILLESRIFITFLISYKINFKELNKNGGGSRNVLIKFDGNEVIDNRGIHSAITLLG